MGNTGLSKIELIKKGQPSAIDWRKPAKLVTFAILAYVFLKWGVPELEILFKHLLKVVGQLIALIISGVILFALVVLISKPTFRRACNYFLEALAKLVTLGSISFDEWVIQEHQIDVADENVTTSEEETKKIEAIASKLDKDVQENIRGEIQANKEYEIATRHGDEEHAEDSQLEAQRCREYIDSISPTVEDMKFIISESYSMQKKLKRNIKNLRLDLKKQKDIYYAYMAGSKGLSALKKAWIGDPGLNKDADLAKENIKNKIALFTGQMRTNMEILGQISKDQNYRDRAKFEIARERMKTLSSNVPDGETPMIEAPHSTTFSGIALPQKMKSNYDDLIN